MSLARRCGCFCLDVVWRVAQRPRSPLIGRCCEKTDRNSIWTCLWATANPDRLVSVWSQVWSQLPQSSTVHYPDTTHLWETTTHGPNTVRVIFSITTGLCECHSRPGVFGQENRYVTWLHWNSTETRTVWSVPACLVFMTNRPGTQLHTAFINIKDDKRKHITTCPSKRVSLRKKRQWSRGLQTGLTCVSAKRETKQKAVGYEA